jgi:polyhydroxybutyrate depolymerase
MRLPSSPPAAIAALLAVAVASLAPACTSPDPAPPPAPAGGAAAACTPTPVPDRFHVVESGGRRRRYLLSVPDSPPGPDGYPLVVSLHGHGSGARDHEANTSLAARGRAEGFAVVTPEALGDPRRWNFDRRAGGPDDYAFLAGLVDDLVGRSCADPARLYLAGSSNGAAFAGLWACAGHAQVAAVAMVIATVPPGCPPEVTPSVLTVRGTADVTVPYGATPELVATWADHDGCASPPRDDTPYPGVARTAWGGCAGGGRVVLDTVAGGVHAWPGGTGADRPGNSPAGIGYPATDEVLAFFAAVGQAS